MVLPPLALVGLGIALGVRGRIGYEEHHPQRFAEHPSSQASAAPISSHDTEPQMVEIVIDSTPPSDVYEGDQKLGPTPYEAHWRKAPGRKHLTLKAAGFVSQDVDVDTDESGLVSTQLAEAKLVKPRSHGTSGASSKPSATTVSSDLAVPSFP